MGLEIRKGLDSDRQEIIELIRQVFGDEAAERTDRRWEWQWHQDPKLETPGYQGIVVVWDGRVIASMSTIPSGLYIRGELLPDAVWFTDALAHWGLVRKAMRAVRKSGEGMGSIDWSKGLVGAILSHPECPRHHLGKHITDPMRVVAYKIGSKDQSGTGSWARTVSLKRLIGRYLGRFTGWAIGSFADLFLPRIPRPSLEVSRLEGPFDARFDRLFAEALKCHEAITRRDAAVLNWRYRQNPDSLYEVMTVSREDELLGYLVLGRFERHGQPRAHVLDLLARNDDPEVLESLLAETLCQLRREGVARIECYLGARAIQQVLEKIGFKQRLHEGKPMMAAVTRIEVPELYVTRGDGDGG